VCRISLPSQAMALSDEEFPIVAESLAAIEEAQDDGVNVFGDGIEKVPPVLFSRRRVGNNRDLPRHGDLGRIHDLRAASIRILGEAREG